MGGVMGIATKKKRKNREKKRARLTHIFFETDNRPLRRPSPPCNNANRRNHRRRRDQTLSHPLSTRATDQDRTTTLLIPSIRINWTLGIPLALQDRGNVISTGTGS